MAGLGYPCYGFNVLNANGETNSLPFARLSGVTSQLGSLSVAFNAVDSDEYGMVFPNQGSTSGTFSCVRTTVAGLYEIELDVLAVSGAGAGTSEVDIYVDKQAVFDASTGTFTAAGSGSGYALCQHRVYIAAATSNSSHTIKKTIFLERDCYVSLSHATPSGTGTALSTYDYGYFLVRCISTDNSGKTSYQTV